MVHRSAFFEQGLRRGIRGWGHQLKASSRLNFVASFVVNFVETTTKEPAMAASGHLSTKLATKRKDDKHV
jgi:hypothetical protein